MEEWSVKRGGFVVDAFEGGEDVVGVIVGLPCERLDRLEKCVSVSRMKIPVQSFFTAVIDDTDVHLIGVQVDSAVEWMLFLIQIHWFSLWLSKY